MCILDNILQVMKEKHISQKVITDTLGLSKSSFSSWKSGANESYKKRLPEIATILGVSVSYLTGESKNREITLNNEITDNDLKFALFGDVEIDDEVLEEVRHYAQIAKKMREEKNKDGNTK